MNLKKLFFLFSFFLLLSCGTLQQGGYIIDDFLIVPTEATNNIGTKHLNVFVFENDLITPQIEWLLAEKYKLETYQIRKSRVEDNKELFYIKVLDRHETERYLDVSQYGAQNQETKGNRDINQSKFLAISITDESGTDCLSQKSLYYNIAVKFLQKLKKEYLRK